jgi:hypothetical protein
MDAAVRTQLLGEGAAFDELHNDVWRPVVLADHPERDTVGWVKLPPGSSLAQQPLAHSRVGGEVVAQQLDRGPPAQGAVVRGDHP